MSSQLSCNTGTECSAGQAVVAVRGEYDLARIGHRFGNDPVGPLDECAGQQILAGLDGLAERVEHLGGGVRAYPDNQQLRVVEPEQSNGVAEWWAVDVVVAASRCPVRATDVGDEPAGPADQALLR
jgi:hypothetical protein